MSAPTARQPTQFVRAFLDYDSQKESIAIHEYHLLTDANVYGEARDVGPFSFINTLAHAGASFNRGLRPAITLRVKYSGMQQYNVKFDDDFKHYSGGDLEDEIASVCTLMLGVRIVAGSLKREYYEGTDPLGAPREFQTKVTPFFQANYERLRLPRACVDINISELSVIQRMSKIPTNISTALVKASRLYQQALLMCEALPEMAWLLLVSALETAAAEHAYHVTDKRAVFRKSYPDVVDMLSSHAPVEEALAKYFFNLSRSKAKFAEFFNTFLPPPPYNRPPPAFCFEMSQPKLDLAVSTIYKHRSTHLHGGTAFPGPMCEPPRYYTFSDHPAHGFQEKPMGHGANYSGASWSEASCPMLLHHFEYLVRGCILKWWASYDSDLSINVDGREMRNNAN